MTVHHARPRRPLEGQFTCYEPRTNHVLPNHVLPTHGTNELDNAVKPLYGPCTDLDRLAIETRRRCLRFGPLDDSSMLSLAISMAAGHVDVGMDGPLSLP